MFSSLSKERNHYLSALNLPSANAFNLVKAKILLFGKELKDTGEAKPQTNNNANHLVESPNNKHQSHREEGAFFPGKL